MEFERRILWDQGFDCIRFKCVHGKDTTCYPGSGGSHGVQGLHIRFVLINKSGSSAVYLLLYTNWIPEMERFSKTSPNPAEVGYHSSTPLEVEQNINTHCDILPGGKCYSDCHYTTVPENAFLSLLNGGIEALWEFLEGYYLYTFEGRENLPLKFPYPFERRVNE